MSFRWPSNQSRVWPLAGLAVLAASAGVTAFFVGRGPAPLKASQDGGLFQGDPKGLQGSLTESFGKGRLVLTYGSIQGQRENLRLETLQARLEEAEALWQITAPSGTRVREAWTLDAPLALEARGAGNTLLGKGSVAGSGPGLRWADGGWRGLLPLRWTDFTGQGTWSIPAGWTRSAEGRLAAAGDILWIPGRPGGLERLEAKSVEAGLGFQDGSLGEARAVFPDGEVRAPRTLLDPRTLRWPASLAFERSDGWKGRAAEGFSPRPEAAEGARLLELKGFQAERGLPEGIERLAALGARWSPEGILLEGSVTWEQPFQGMMAKLTAPRLVMRTAEGAGLPADLAVGQARAEGQALLTWGTRSLGSPRILADRAKRTWTLEAPVNGRSREGAFSAGAGRGNARAWTFDGPIQATLFNGGTLQGAQLRWEGEAWILTGRPAVWHRLQERLSGPRVVRAGERVEFPDGLAGQVQASAGDLFLRADHGESTADRITLRGHVECEGLGWQVGADLLTVQFGPGRVVRNLQARGGVSLRGRMGEGRGEALTVDPASQQVVWQGRVRGLSEDLIK
jgi:hypothetical protein